MIRQYLSQTNESATVPVLQKFLELNKAQMMISVMLYRVKESCEQFSCRHSQWELFGPSDLQSCNWLPGYVQRDVQFFL